MTPVGHEDAFPPLRLSAGFQFSQPIFAATLGNGRDAPRPVIARATIELADAATSLLARTTWWAAPITV